MGGWVGICTIERACTLFVIRTWVASIISSYSRSQRFQLNSKLQRAKRWVPRQNVTKSTLYKTVHNSGGVSYSELLESSSSCEEVRDVIGWFVYLLRSIRGCCHSTSGTLCGPDVTATWLVASTDKFPPVPTITPVLSETRMFVICTGEASEHKTQWFYFTFTITVN